MKDIGTIIGWIAAAICLLLYVSKKRERIFAIKLSTDFLWITNMLLLGLYTGLVVQAIAVGRSLVFSQRGKAKWADHPFWLVLFIALTLISPILTWAGPVSLLPAIGSVTSTLSFYCKRPQHIRYFALPTCILWGAYGLLCQNYPSMVSNIFSLISAIVGIWREGCTQKHS